MATNRYGEVNTQPLYNATGRLNRGEPVAPQPFQAPNSGASRQWGSNSGFPQSNPNPLLSSMTSYFSPVNLYDIMQNQRPGRGRNRGGNSQGTGQDSGGTPTININLGDVNFAEQNRNANAKIIRGAAQQPAAAPGTAPRQRKQITQEQRDRKNAQQRAKRAAAKNQPQGQQPAGTKPGGAKPGGAKPKTPKGPSSPPAPSSPPSQSSAGSMSVSSDSAAATQAYAPSISTGGGDGSPYAPQSPGGSSWLSNFANARGGTIH